MSMSGRAPAVAMVAAVALAGCGSGGHVGGHLDVQGQTTPADAVSVSVAINGHEVIVSPRRIGAGQMIFTVVNNDARAVTLVVRPLHRRGVLTVNGRRVSYVDSPASLGRVPGNGTLQIKRSIRPGLYVLESPMPGIDALPPGYRPTKSTVLTVGPSGSGGDNSIDQP